MNEIFQRTSVRSYSDQKVDRGSLQKLLMAGMQAPSAVNQQPWDFIVVDDADDIASLRALHPYATSLETAPACIVVLAKKDDLAVPGMVMQDLGACVENILLEAVSLDLGCCWMGAMGNPEHAGVFDELLKLPADREVFCLIAVGHPKSPAAQRSRFDPSRIHWNRY